MRVNGHGRICQKLENSAPMKELLRTNDVVLLSFAKSMLEDHGIEPIVLDSYTSVVEGSLGVLPRRLMVVDDDESRARDLLSQHEIDCRSDA